MNKGRKQPPSIFENDELFAASGAADRNETSHGGLTGSGPLTEQLDSNFMQYARYVIGSRAIPAVEDGLKPVQRRILHALWEIDSGKLMKLPLAVGRAMRYHPHGEASIGPALVVLVNKLWGKDRGYIIEGQGNFGNLFTGAEAAAPRYLECRLTDLAKKQLYNPKTTEYVPAYDGENQEPVFLPCKIPLLLMMGAEGVAVGLSTSVLPHNFPELLRAEIDILRGRKVSVLPDFQLGGVMDASEYEDGLGKVKVRAVIEKEDKNKLVIRELPWGETTESIIESIRQAVEKKRLGVRHIENLTSRQVEVVLNLQAGESQEKILEGLYAYTTCQKTLSSRPIVLKEGRPMEMRVSEILRDNVERLVALTRKELEIRLQELADQFHAKTLDQIFVEERIYKKIEEEETEESVERAVMDGFKPFLKKIRRKSITLDDVKRLLEIKIKRISRFDIRKNETELRHIENQEAETRKNLNGLTGYVIGYLKGLLKEYEKKYPRCTVVSEKPFVKADMRAITAEDLVVRLDRESHFAGVAVKTGDELFRCSGLDKLLFVWKDGRYKMLPVPDKFFVDIDLERISIYDREKEMTLVYEDGEYGHVYAKRFMFGGMIQNKEYRLAPPKSKVLLLQEGCPDRIYVKFRPAKNQRVHQAYYDTADLQLRSASARGLQITTKSVARISTTKPSWWSGSDDGEKGSFF